MNRRPGLAAASVFGCCWIGFAAGADSATKSFRHSSAKDFEEGETSASTILPTGVIVPGLRTSRVGVDAAFVWCSALGRDGLTAYFGSGDDGKVFSVATQKSADSGGARLVAKLDVPWVSALAALADGRLLAAGNPGGQIVALDPARGTQKPWARIPAAHVWALAYDDRSRVTYVASGIPGKIFVVDARSATPLQARMLWDAHDEHVLSLWQEGSGRLLAGTAERAILYRVFADGRAEAVHDFEADEVRAIVGAPSGLYVAVNDFEKAGPTPSGGTPTAPAPAKGTKVALPATGASSTRPAPASMAPLPRPGMRKSKAALYRIDLAGRIEQVFALADGYLTSLLVAGDGGVWAASGTQGRVYRIDPDGTAALVVDLPERQILTLSRAGADLWLGTGDAAAVYVARENQASATSARYVSKVLDAEYPAAWGTLHWQGRDVSFETRAGNTADPDESWRSWRPITLPTPAPPSPSAPAARPADAGVGRVGVEASRYLQYRATLQSTSARLRSVTAYFLPQNQRARITEVTVADSGAVTPGVGQGAAAAPAETARATGAGTLAGRPQHSAIVKVRWKVDNEDEDDLVYRLTVRTLNETNGRPLAGMGGATGEPLAKPEFDWNTDSLPDGQYVVRVTASDERSQPIDRALDSFLDSEPILIDNRKPDVVQIVAKYPVISARVQDSASAITQIEVALDGGEWRGISPADGIADENTEFVSVTLPKLASGSHSVAIRATDSNDNVGGTQIEVRAP